MKFGILVMAVFLILACPSWIGFARSEAEKKLSDQPKSYSADELTEKEPIPWWEKIWIVKKGRRLLG